MNFVRKMVLIPLEQYESLTKKESGNIDESKGSVQSENNTEPQSIEEAVPILKSEDDSIVHDSALQSGGGVPNIPPPPGIPNKKRRRRRNRTQLVKWIKLDYDV